MRWMTTMGAELRIESDEIVRLAEELAALRKISVPDAVTDALRKQVEREREVQERTERMLAIGREIRAHLHTHLLQSDIRDMLYGPDGLPA